LVNLDERNFYVAILRDGGISVLFSYGQMGVMEGADMDCIGLVIWQAGVCYGGLVKFNLEDVALG